MFVSGFVLDTAPVRAGVEPVRALKDVRHALHRRGIGSGRRARAGEARIRPRRRIRFALPLGRDEEVNLVLHDRAAQREAELLLLEIARAQERHVGSEILIAEVVVRRAVELVRAALRDGVDQRAGEVPLAHVERRQQHLILLHRFERRSTRPRACPPGWPVVPRPKMSLSLAPSIWMLLKRLFCAARGQAGVLRLQHLRRERKEVGEVAVERGQPAKRRVRDVRLHAAARRRDLIAQRIRRRAHGDHRELRGLRVQLEARPKILAE